MTDDILEPQAPPAEPVPVHDAPEVEPEVVVEQEPESDREADGEREPSPEATGERESDLDSEPIAESEPDPDPIAEPELAGVQASELDSEPIVEAASEQEPGLDSQPSGDREPEPDHDSEVIAELDSEMTNGPEIDSGLEPDPKATIDAERDSDSTPDSDAAPEAPALTATLRFPVVGEVPDESSADTPDDTSSSDAPADAPRLRDVAAAFAGWARAIPRRAGAVLASHKLLVAALALACVGLALAGTLFFLHSTQTPSDGLIESDARERLAAPTAAKSDYGLDEPLVLTDVTVVDKHAGSARSDACDVALEVRYANAAVEATADATLTYVRDASDAWSCTAARMDDSSYRATAGVSTDAVVAHLDTLLSAAGADEDEGAQLVELYQGADVELVGEHFNEELQTDSLTLHCARGTAFMSRECDLTVHFRFVPASGAWELTEARVSDDAFELGFQPLVGTWEGTFLSQEAKGGKCLAARELGIAITITRTSINKDGVALVEGTLTGVAHLHDPVEANVESHADDELLEDLPFAGTLRTADGKGRVQNDLFALLSGENGGSDATGIVFDCVTQDMAQGTVSLTLDFGAGDDPDAVTATLTSEHPYQETFALLWTFDATSHYEDTFALTKTE